MGPPRVIGTQLPPERQWYSKEGVGTKHLNLSLFTPSSFTLLSSISQKPLETSWQGAGACVNLGGHRARHRGMEKMDLGETNGE